MTRWGRYSEESALALVIALFILAAVAIGVLIVIFGGRTF